MKDIIEHFGSQSALARALKVAPEAVSQWVSNGYLPPKRAIEIEIITEGKFKAIELITGFTL